MPFWIETKKEIEKRGNDFDGVRRERIRAVEEITGRPLIIYATDFLNREKVAQSGGEVIIDGSDKIGFDEVTSTIKGPDLDILVHSPGGDPNAAEAIVSLLRSRYSNLRFIVPDQAKSAATMICCAGDEILMDDRSELGPIDPQIIITRGDKVPVSAPAQSIINQFDKAKESLAKNPNHLPAWLPILQPLGPSLLSECEAADELSRVLVTNWLTNYMFSNIEKGAELAERFASFLANSQEHKSHGRRIGIEQLGEFGLNVTDLRNHPELRDAVWNLYQAIVCTFQGTTTFKIIENGRGGAYIRHLIIQQIRLPIPTEGKRAPQEQISKGAKRRRGRNQ